MLFGSPRNVAYAADKRSVLNISCEHAAHRFHFMAETMPQKIFTATANGDVDYFNRQWTEFTGLGFDQFRDWGWTQFIHPDDVEENIRVWQHSIETGEPFEFVHRFRRADGAYRQHLSRARAMRNVSGNTSMWIGSNTEIHEQKEMAETLRPREEALRESEAYLRLVLRFGQTVSMASIATASPPPATPLSCAWSSAPRTWAARSCTMSSTTPMRTVLPTRRRSATFTGPLGPEGPRTSINELFFRLDGSSFPVEYWSYPLHRDDEVHGAVTTFIDITERRLAQEQQLFSSRK